MQDNRWVFVIKVHDKPGTLTAIASVFSSRGVSVETTMGSSSAVAPLEVPSTIVLSFRATERKKEHLMRTIARLQQVIHVEAYPYHARELRAIAVARLAATEHLDDLPHGVQAENISETADTKTVLLAGATQAVEKTLLQLRERGSLHDVVTTVMAV